MELTKLAGYKLGKRIVRYEERDAILYALAVGATGSETDLVYERDLRVLPTYACALGLWTVEAAGELKGDCDAKSNNGNSEISILH